MKTIDDIIELLDKKSKTNDFKNCDISEFYDKSDKYIHNENIIENNLNKQ